MKMLFFPEFTMVKLRADVCSMPVGAVGTIIHIHTGGEAYVVEFTTPYHDIITVKKENLERL